MNHSFIHLARTFCAVPETHSHKVLPWYTPQARPQDQDKTLACFITHINASKTEANVHYLAFKFFPMRLFRDNQHWGSVAMLTWLRESFFIRAINPKSTGHKALWATVVMSSLWKCYPSALNPSATCWEKAATLRSRNPLNQTTLLFFYRN